MRHVLYYHKRYHSLSTYEARGQFHEKTLDGLLTQESCHLWHSGRHTGVPLDACDGCRGQYNASVETNINAILMPLPIQAMLRLLTAATLIRIRIPIGPACPF